MYKKALLLCLGLATCFAADSKPKATDSQPYLTRSELTKAGKEFGNLCRNGFEFSFKLARSKLKQRGDGIRGFTTDLARVERDLTWFKLRSVKPEPEQLQRVQFLDTPKSIFASHNIQVRFRKRLSGSRKADLVLKDQSNKKSVTEKMPVTYKKKWKHVAHCKSEANVYADGFLDWQHGTKINPTKALSQRVFNDHPTHLHNISVFFPWVPRLLGVRDATSSADLPLRVTRTEYRWVQKIGMEFEDGGKVTRLTGVITLQYKSQADLEAESAQPIDADFEWKSTKGQKTWKTNVQSDKLLEWLTLKSPYSDKTANLAVGLAQAVALRATQRTEHKYQEPASHFVDPRGGFQMFFCALVGLLVLLVAISVLRCKTSRTGFDEHDAYIMITDDRIP